ncbi:hypothetical protein Kfla_5844 [Kribbella flavida DSM 17836]|uniref:Uncharacterized protein n=1 Tax=Kribbella flavida (strain DSM 17836 / JCM 10339 / NBRC 14399) TaxID=479435 RepID=D2PRD0_KRIFD|nr:hypothetical protein Kfla_5844 [Kribbella flavida DSM 17836]
MVLSLLVRDLQSTGGISLQVRDEPVNGDSEYESVWLLSRDGSRTGLLAPLAMAEPDRVVHVADQVQEFVHEELWGLGRPATWPECLEHPGTHPLQPERTPKGPGWVCPKSGHTAGCIGEL